MKQVKTIMIGALIAISGLFVASAFAADHKASDGTSGKTKFNLEAVTCWDVITLPEEGEADALLLLYGYDAGKEGKPHMSGDMIESDLENLVDYCEENPDVRALQAINKAQ